MTFIEVFTTFILPTLLGFLGSLGGLALLWRAISQTKPENQKTQAEAKDLEITTVERLEGLIEKKDIKIADLQGQIDDLRTSYQNLSDVVGSQKDELDGLRESKARLEELRDSQGREIQSLRHRVQVLEEYLRLKKLPIPQNGETHSETPIKKRRKDGTIR